MSKDNKTTRVLVIPPSEKLPSFQIGIRQPFDRLQQQQVIRYRVLPEYNVSKAELLEEDVVVFLRNTNALAYEWFELSQALGKKTVYSIDDHFLHLPKRGFGLAMEDPARRECFEAFLRNADTVRVGSPYFAEHIRRHYNRRVACIQASVDFSWLDRAGDKTRSARELVIGYEGSYKENDFAVVVPALQRLMSEYGRKLRLEFHGYVPAELLKKPGVVYFPGGWEYRRYLHFLCQRAWDIGLAPLEDTLYNRCKSNNKFREYAACGITGIYSRIPTYADCVTDRSTGLLVGHTPKGWYEGIKRLIEDEPLRRQIRSQANRFARERYTIERCAEEWQSLLCESRGDEA